MLFYSLQEFNSERFCPPMRRPDDGAAIYPPGYLCAACYKIQPTEVQEGYAPSPTDGAKYRIKTWCQLCMREGYRGENPINRPRRVPVTRWRR